MTRMNADREKSLETLLSMACLGPIRAYPRESVAKEAFL